MAKIIGANINVNDTGTTPNRISIGSVDAVAVKPSTGLENPHQEFTISHNGNKTLWLRKYAASVDDLKKGEPVYPGESKTFQLPNMVTSEWSAIFESGVAKDVFTQYS